ncbi:unnamed protein product [Euphydryas editha]|uniref:Uncharacterized protein n=1 Tax=Euphydryas editha TaxID=104508 RepID=A0AAU9UX72_EUPED|nr:unnamed protein product [Euphydryas editha]
MKTVLKKVTAYYGRLMASIKHKFIAYENREEHLSFLKPVVKPPSPSTEPVFMELPLSGSERLKLKIAAQIFTTTTFESKRDKEECDSRNQLGHLQKILQISTSVEAKSCWKWIKAAKAAIFNNDTCQGLAATKNDVDKWGTGVWKAVPSSSSSSSNFDKNLEIVATPQSKPPKT